MKLYIADAFSSKPFGGNGAGIVVGAGLDDIKMQKLAAELKFSETAFIEEVNGSTFKIRFFTPVSEVDLCGHATVAAFKCLLSEGIIKDNNTYKMDCCAGTLDVIVEDELIMLEQAKPKVGEILKNDEFINSIAEILRLHPGDIGDNTYNLYPQIISTGLFDIILPLKSYDCLNKIRPNFEALTSFSKNLNVVGIHAFTLDSESSTARCRNFAPLYGINEEAATGTASGALLYYLYINKVIRDIKRDIEFIQGESMGRTSKIYCRINSNNNDLKLMIGGYASIISKGDLLI